MPTTPLTRLREKEKKLKGFHILLSQNTFVFGREMVTE